MASLALLRCLSRRLTTLSLKALHQIGDGDLAAGHIGRRRGA
jgi:hypothetical protein